MRTMNDGGDNYDEDNWYVRSSTCPEIFDGHVCQNFIVTIG